MSDPAPPRFVDIAHLIFLEMIEQRLRETSPGEVSRFLVRAATATAASFPRVDFTSFDDFVAAIEDLRNPIARVEGRAEHLGGGLFGLGRCPFAETHRSRRHQPGALSGDLAAVQHEFNQPSADNAELAVGHGSAVCPFCCAHQPLRAALGARITIAGRPIRVVQLACKGADGSRAFADDFIATTGHTHAEVDGVLDQYVCCYAVVV
jgi:hypothetical protein